MSKSGMDSKKDTGEIAKTNYFTPSGIRAFMLEVLSEFRKIAWPAKKTTAGLTGFVILLVVVISLFLGSTDMVLGKIVSMILR